MHLKQWSLIGVIATAFLAIALPLYALAETERMDGAQAQLLQESIEKGEVTYAENCVVCHGVAGEGISTYPTLDNESVRQMAYDDLYKVIERGRYGTAMAAWGIHEGGVLNDMEIDQLVAMIQQGSWSSTAATVEKLGLTLPTVITIEISDETLAQLAQLPHGEVIAPALPIFAANCAGCHGPQGEGTGIAPALNDPSLREKRTDEEWRRSITNGVAGTLMAGWGNTLPAADIDNLVGLIRYFDEIPAGVIPQPELPPITSTDVEIIAAGEALFNIACAQCHGSAGQGSPMAPALNVQSFLTATNDQAIKAIISNGVPNTRMPAWGGRLNDEQLNALVSFLRSWQPTAPAVAQPSTGGGGMMMPGSSTNPTMGPPWMRNP